MFHIESTMNYVTADTRESSIQHVRRGRTWNIFHSPVGCFTFDVFCFHIHDGHTSNSQMSSKTHKAKGLLMFKSAQMCWSCPMAFMEPWRRFENSRETSEKTSGKLQEHKVSGRPDINSEVRNWLARRAVEDEWNTFIDVPPSRSPLHPLLNFLRQSVAQCLFRSCVFHRLCMTEIWK